MKKRSEGVIFGLAIFSLIVIFLILGFFIKPEGYKKIANDVGDYFSEKSDNKNNNEVTENVDSSDSGVSSDNSAEAGAGGGGGAGGGSSSGDSGGSDSDSSGCPEIQFAYSIGEVYTNPVCLDYIGESCVEKKINCYSEIRNLEEDLSGLFEIEFVFYEVENRENILSSEQKSLFLLANERRMINSSLVLQNENLNLNVSCYFNTISVPKKSSC